MLRGTTWFCRLLILSAAISQTSCKTNNEIPVPAPTNQEANVGMDPRSVLSADTFAADVVGDRLIFPTLPEVLLKANPDVSLEIEFRGNRTFPTDKISLAVNGIRGETENFGLSEHAKWETREDAHVLVVNLSHLRFDDGLSFLAKVRRLHSRRGKLGLWVRAPHRIARARFHCGHPLPPVTPPVPLPSSELPTVTFDLKPRNPTPSRIALFAFHSRKPITAFECALDGQRFRPCWNLVVYFGLSVGQHRFEVRGLTRSGQTGPTARYDWTISTRNQYSVEITSATPAESATTSSNMTITYRLSGGSFWPWQQPSGSTQCRLDGGAFLPCSSPVSYSALGEGNHTVDIRLTSDTVGTAGDSYSWTVDKTAPQIQWVTTPSTLSTSDDAAFTFQSTEASRYECKLDDGAIYSCETNTSVSNLTDGPHFFEVHAIDLAGNRSEALQYNWDIDTHGPSVVLTSVNPPQLVNNSRESNFFFSAEDAVAFECSLDGGNYSICSTTWTVSSLSEGAHFVDIRAYDGAGNTGDALHYAWRVDFTSPSLTLFMAFPSQSPSQETSARFTFATNDADTNFFCSLDGGAESACASPLEMTSLPEGEHELVVRAVDSANNESRESMRWVVDHTAPRITLTTADPSEPLTTSQTMRLEFSLSEPSTVTCELDQAGSFPCSTQVSFNFLADGHHVFNVNAIDASGNVADTLVYEWTVATTVFATIDSWQPDAALSTSRSARFDFSAQLASSFQCSLDGNAFEACTSPANYSLLPDGAHEFRVRALNVGGMPGPVESRGWSVDATAPVVTVTSRDPNYSPTSRTTMTVNFSASEGDLRCSLDGAPADTCASPLTLSGLSSAAHVLVITATDAAGNVGQASVSWNVDSSPLVISSVAITSITSNSALLTWRTNVPATSQVLYGEGSLLNQSTSATSVYATDHSVLITGLRRFTFHSVQTRSVDRDGRSALSDVLTFRTAN